MRWVMTGSGGVLPIKAIPTRPRSAAARASIGPSTIMTPSDPSSRLLHGCTTIRASPLGTAGERYRMECSIIARAW